MSDTSHTLIKHRKCWKVPDDGVWELQALQAQTLQQPAATDDALQSRRGDDGAGQIKMKDLQWAERQKNKLNTWTQYMSLRLVFVHALKVLLNTTTHNTYTLHSSGKHLCMKWDTYI